MCSRSSGRSPQRRTARGDSGYRPSRDPTVVLLVLITVGVLVAMVAGIGPGDVVGGDDDTPTPAGTDRTTTTEPGGPPSVTVTANESEVLVGGRVTITVRTDDGPVENAVVSVGDRQRRTGPDGTVVLALDRPGRVRVTADPPTDRYSSGSTTVRVRRHEVAMSVAVEEASVVTTQPVRVSVTYPNGSPVNGSVVAGGTTVSTGQDGVATVSFATAGRYNVTAERPPTRTERFTADQVAVAVARRPVDLSVAANDTGVLVDERVALTVTRADTNETVNTTLLVGDTPRTTGPDGTLVLAFSRAGSYDIRANASPTDAVRFEPVERRIHVSRQVADLDLSISPDQASTGENVTVVLRRDDTGERTSGVIRARGKTYRVGSDGTLSVAFSDPGHVSVVGTRSPSRTHRFEPANGRVLVLGATFLVENLTAPDRVVAGDEYNVTAVVRNDGNQPGNATVVYRRNGSAVASMELRLDPNVVRTVRFTVVAPDDPGTYDHAVVASDGASRGELHVRSGNRSTAVIPHWNSRPVHPVLVPPERGAAATRPTPRNDPTNVLTELLAQKIR